MVGSEVFELAFESFWAEAMSRHVEFGIGPSSPLGRSPDLRDGLFGPVQWALPRAESGILFLVEQDDSKGSNWVGFHLHLLRDCVGPKYW